MSASLMVKRSGKRDIRDELRSLAARVLAPLAMCVIGLPVILAVALITVVVPAVLALGVIVVAPVVLVESVRKRWRGGLYASLVYGVRRRRDPRQLA